MKNAFTLIRLSAALVVIALAAGCASVPMKPTTAVTKAKPDTVLVTFVRQSIWMGDGIAVDLWDGDKYIGSLGPGTIVQYETQAGEHLFLGNAENWSYASATLAPGRQYFIKANMFPGALTMRVALTTVESTDERIPEWYQWKAMTVDGEKAKAFEAKKQPAVAQAIANFKDGKVASFATVKPEDGL